MPSKIEQIKRTSILLAALGQYAAKSVNRSHLVDGSSTPITAEVTGTVGRGRVELSVAGTLSVGSPSKYARSSAPPTDQLVACLLAELPSDTDRARVMTRLAKQFAKGGGLPCDAKALKAAKVWLAGMRSTTPQTRAGTVSFAPEG